MKRTASVFAAIAAALTFASGAARAESLPLAIGAATAVDHAAIFAGVEKGFFAQHGLNAKSIMYETGVEEISGAAERRPAGERDGRSPGSSPAPPPASR